MVLNLGRVVRTDIGPGLHFKWPLVETARVFDRRLQVLDAEPERYLTSERKDVSVDFFAVGYDRRRARVLPRHRRRREDRGRSAWRRSSRTRCATRSTRARCSRWCPATAATIVGKQLDRRSTTAPPRWACASSTCASSRSTCRTDSEVISDVYDRMRAAAQAGRQPAARRRRGAGPDHPRPGRPRADGDRGRGRARRAAAARRGRCRSRRASTPRRPTATRRSTPSSAAWRPTASRSPTATSVIVLDRDDPFLQYMRSDR